MEAKHDLGASSGKLVAAGLEAPGVGRWVPRSGAPALRGALPFLDKEGGNLPRVRDTPSWIKKQWLTRRVVLDRLRYWQTNGYQCVWATLTSSPSSPAKRLRGNFQALRKRIDRDLGFSGLEYVCVDTREGHGVLHMIWAWKDSNPRMKASFYVPFEWLQGQWNRIHGAFHVNVKRIGGADEDARRLSRYIVAQYCGDQNALVRLSQSRMAVPFAKMRQQLLRSLRGSAERYEHGHKLMAQVPREELTRVFNGWFWAEFRQSWDSLVRVRSCTAYGVQFVWWDGALRRV